MAGSDWRAWQLRPRPVTTSHEVGRGVGVVGDDRACGRILSAHGVGPPPRCGPLGQSLVMVPNRAVIFPGGLAPPRYGCSCGSCGAGLDFVLTIAQMLSTCWVEARRLRESLPSKQECQIKYKTPS